jgi:hypothetical protein
MNSYQVLFQALKEGLVEREKATATVDALIKKIAEKKKEKLDEFTKQEEPYLSEGFVYVDSKVQSLWRDEFVLESCFIRKDVKIPPCATKRERELLSKYQKLIKNVTWENRWRLKDVLEDSKSISHDLRYLKNGIEIIKAVYFTFTSDKLLDEKLLERGFSFK